MFYSCTNDFHKQKKHIHIILKPFSILNPNLITLNSDSTDFFLSSSKDRILTFSDFLLFVVV